MPFTVTMPKLSPTMSEGTIAKWQVKEGDFVKAGQIFMEVATDKATVECEALDEGYVGKILVQEGGAALVNAPVAVFTEKKGESLEGYKPQGIVVAPVEGSSQEEVPAEDRAAKASSSSVSEKSLAGLTQPAFAPPPPLTGYTFPGREQKGKKASPLARRLAQEKSLDLSQVAGSGPGGRVVARDLGKAPSQGVVSFGGHEAPTLPPGTFEEEAMTPMRKVIGQRLQEAKTFIPHFYVTQSIDALPMVRVRKELAEYGLKVTFNDLIVRAVALSLREHPEVNSGFNSVHQTLTRYKTIDIAVAVSVEGGLITPIVRHADYKNLGEISAEVKELAKRAKEGKLKPEEYTGGSFTISNLGMYGVDEFIAIVNPPQGAILAVAGIQEVPVVREGAVVPGKVMKVTLSSDHRLIDGAIAASFLHTLKTYLENPSGLLV